MAIRVLLLVTDLEVGGAPLVVKDLACGLAEEEGFHVEVACLAGAGPIAAELRQTGIAAHCLGARGPWDARVFYRLARLIAHLQPHVLQCALMHANLAGRVIGRLLSVPHVVAGIHTPEKGKRWHLVLENLTARLSDVTVCISPSVQRHVRCHAHLPASHLVVIPNGIDVLRLAAAPPAPLADLHLDPSRRTVLFVGRLDPVKAVDVLLHALVPVLARHDAQLLIIGDGPERPRLEQLAGRLQLGGRVCFAGTRRDVPNWLKAADLFILPSRWEGLGVAALEAMAAGLPVIASRTDGLVDLIEHERTGLLVAPDDPAALAAAIVSLLDDPDRARRLSQAAQARAAHAFCRRTMIAAYADLYRRLLCRPRSHSACCPPLAVDNAPQASAGRAC